ncbi:hypothetical protein B0H19DRAFT_1241895 [Mycena capillaripes]|nr:hypothetical protein B0H19DRAFT_1241895 [Mycena capillaripes]
MICTTTAQYGAFVVPMMPDLTGHGRGSMARDPPVGAPKAMCRRDSSPTMATCSWDSRRTKAMPSLCGDMTASAAESGLAPTSLRVPSSLRALVACLVTPRADYKPVFISPGQNTLFLIHCGSALAVSRLNPEYEPGVWAGMSWLKYDSLIVPELWSQEIAEAQHLLIALSFSSMKPQRRDFSWCLEPEVASSRAKVPKPNKKLFIMRSGIINRALPRGASLRSRSLDTAPWNVAAAQATRPVFHRSNLLSNGDFCTGDKRAPERQIGRAKKLGTWTVECDPSRVRVDDFRPIRAPAAARRVIAPARPPRAHELYSRARRALPRLRRAPVYLIARPGAARSFGARADVSDGLHPPPPRTPSNALVTISNALALLASPIVSCSSTPPPRYAVLGSGLVLPRLLLAEGAPVVWATKALCDGEGLGVGGQLERVQRRSRMCVRVRVCVFVLVLVLVLVRLSFPRKSFSVRHKEERVTIPRTLAQSRWAGSWLPEWGGCCCGFQERLHAHALSEGEATDGMRGSRVRTLRSPRNNTSPYAAAGREGMHGVDDELKEGRLTSAHPIRPRPRQFVGVGARAATAGGGGTEEGGNEVELREEEEDAVHELVGDEGAQTWWEGDGGSEQEGGEVVQLGRCRHRAGSSMAKEKNSFGKGSTPSVCCRESCRWPARQMYQVEYIHNPSTYNKICLRYATAVERLKSRAQIVMVQKRGDPGREITDGDFSKFHCHIHPQAESKKWELTSSSSYEQHVNKNCRKQTPHWHERDCRKKGLSVKSE